jgi:hypothetical protein
MPKIKQKKFHSSQSLHYHPYDTGKNHKSEISNGINSRSFHEEVGDEESSDNLLLSKGQRKRLEKRQHVQQKLGLIKPLNFKEAPVKATEAKKENKKAKVSYFSNSMEVEVEELGHISKEPVLEELEEAKDIEECTGNKDTTQKKESNLSLELLLTHDQSQSGRSSTIKLTKETAIKELQRMKMILQNPSFQENPLSLIHQQLQLQQNQLKPLQQQRINNPKQERKKEVRF